MILKKGTQVKIISGKDKGKTGEILEINRKLNKVKIKSVNIIKRHTKATKENKGGIISKEKLSVPSKLSFEQLGQFLLKHESQITYFQEQYAVYKK